PVGVGGACCSPGCGPTGAEYACAPGSPEGCWDPGWPGWPCWPGWPGWPAAGGFDPVAGCCGCEYGCGCDPGWACGPNWPGAGAMGGADWAVVRVRSGWTKAKRGSLIPRYGPQCGCTVRPAAIRATAGKVSTSLGPSVRDSTSMIPPHTAKT